MTPEPLHPDFDDDERRFLEELRLPGGKSPWRTCPPIDVLRAADEQALPPDAQERVASHLSGCAFCRSLVHDAKEAGLDAPTDEEHERIRARVRAQSAPAEAVPKRASAGRLAGFQGLALAASLVLAATLGWYARAQSERAGDLERVLETIRDSAAREQQRSAVLEGQLAELREQAARPGGEANVPLVDLEPLGARRNSEATRSFAVPQNARFVTLVLQTEGAGNAGNAGVLTVEIRDARGELRFSMDGLRATNVGIVTLLVPRPGLPDGEAAITLLRGGGGRRVTVGVYRARFESDGSAR